MEKEPLTNSDKKLFSILSNLKSKVDNQIEKNTTDYFSTPRIFVIDPYGRAVMFFDASMDPKLILKDLKVLI